MAKEQYELKMKTESGRNVIIILGHFEHMKQAVAEALTLKDVANAQKFTVQIYEPKLGFRKKINSRG